MVGEDVLKVYATRAAKAGRAIKCVLEDGRAVLVIICRGSAHAGDFGRVSILISDHRINVANPRRSQEVFAGNRPVRAESAVRLALPSLVVAVADVICGRDCRWYEGWSGNFASNHSSLATCCVREAVNDLRSEDLRLHSAVLDRVGGQEDVLVSGPAEEVLGLVRLRKLGLGGCGGAYGRRWDHEFIMHLLRLLLQESVVRGIRLVEDELELAEL